MINRLFLDSVLHYQRSPGSRRPCVAVGTQTHSGLVLMFQLLHLRLQLKDESEEAKRQILYSTKVHIMNESIHWGTIS